MTFDWLIRHQKKVLFVLAVVLVVGWGLGSMIDRLLSARRGGGVDQHIARVAGEEVEEIEYRRFTARWGHVFHRQVFDPKLLRKPTTDWGYLFSYRAFGPDLVRMRGLTVDELAWGYFSLLKLAKESHEVVSEQEYLDSKKALFQLSYPGAQMNKEQMREWLMEKVKIDGNVLDEILGERVLVERTRARLFAAIEPTNLEAWERYRAVNRAVRLRYVPFRRDDYLVEIPQPTEDEIKKYYELHQGRLGKYWDPRRVRIEYAQVMFDKIEDGLKVTVAEMREYYDNHKDLYQITTGEGEDAKTEDTPFTEVKPQIERALKRAKARAQALEILTGIRKAYEGPKETETPKEEKPETDTPKPTETPATPTRSLEELVKLRKDRLVAYFNTPELKEVELLDVPDVGIARAGGQGIAQLAFDLKADNRELSPVMSSNEGMFVMRPMAPAAPGKVPPLAEVKDRVKTDFRKDKAFDKALDAAGEFAKAVDEAGAEDFEKVAAEKKVVKGKLPETPLFVNNTFDANRPTFADRDLPFELDEVYGPMLDTDEGVVAVVKVIEERPADRSAFQAERARGRATILGAKLDLFSRTGFPRNVLAFAEFEFLRSGAGTSDEKKHDSAAKSDAK